MRRWREKILRKFKYRGYRLNIKALNLILLIAPDEAYIKDINLLLNRLLKKKSLTSPINKESIEEVINDTDESTTAASSLKVIDAFVMPKYRFDHVNKRFFEHKGSMPIHGDASAKTSIYRERFMLLSQRVSRAEHFSRPVFDADMSQFKKYEISSIQSLIFEMAKKWVMGLISQLEDGHFYLEDLSASVEIDLSKAK